MYTQYNDCSPLKQKINKRYLAQNPQKRKKETLFPLNLTEQFKRRIYNPKS